MEIEITLTQGFVDWASYQEGRVKSQFIMITGSDGTRKIMDIDDSSHIVEQFYGDGEPTDIKIEEYDYNGDLMTLSPPSSRFGTVDYTFYDACDAPDHGAALLVALGEDLAKWLAAGGTAGA